MQLFETYLGEKKFLYYSRIRCWFVTFLQVGQAGMFFSPRKKKSKQWFVYSSRLLINDFWKNKQKGETWNYCWGDYEIWIVLGRVCSCVNNQCFGIIEKRFGVHLPVVSPYKSNLIDVGWRFGIYNVTVL